MKSPLIKSLRNQTPINKMAISYMTSNNKFYIYEKDIH
jgi:hypothetical protein